LLLPILSRYYLDNVKFKQMLLLPGVILRSVATKNLVCAQKDALFPRNEALRFAQSDITKCNIVKLPSLSGSAPAPGR